MNDDDRVQLVTARLIRTMNPHQPAVTALAIAGERVIAAGEMADLRGRFPAAEHVDFGPTVIVPGFNDAHQHLVDLADAADQLDLIPEEFADHGAILAELANRCAAVPPGRWVRAYRYDETRTPTRPLTRLDLDQISCGHPVAVTHVSDHWAVLNTTALERAGLSTAARADGRVDGADLFRLLWSDDAVVDKPSAADRIRALGKLAGQYNAAGITSIGDALVSAEQFELYGQARRRGNLTVRVNALIDGTHAEEFLAAGNGSGYGDEWLRIGGFKAFVDGAVAGRSCLLEQPFEGSGDHGSQVTATEELSHFFRQVHEAGSVAAVHANGDRAIALLLDVVEQVQGAAPRSAVRHRIEHGTVLNSALLRRIRQAGMAVVPFASYIGWHGAKLLDWYGSARLERMFAHRWLLDHEIPVGGASDYSAGPYEPLIGLRDMVTRRAADGRELGANQRISAEEALWVYTVGSATVAGEEAIKGRLAPGFLADYVVLGNDPLAVAPDALPHIPVRATVVGGRLVWAGDAG